jgi:signal transduction histidine kinase
LLANRALDDALRRLAADLESHSEVRVAVEIEPLAAVLVSRCAADVVQVAREALSNVRRHADASTVQLTLSRAGPRVLLEIIDDGRGLAPNTEPGLGLGNMRARAAALGGELLIGSGERQRGTTIRLSIPL